jgi:glutaredoxin
MTDKARVIFYTKPGCHLCDEAKAEIRRADCQDRFTFEEVNIETDPELKRRYGWDIPVVLIDGTVAFKHRLTAEAFRQAVRQAGQRTGSGRQ